MSAQAGSGFDLGERTGTTEIEMADTHVKHHDYHLVNPSPWPLLASAAALVTAIGAIAWMRTHVDGEGVFGIKGP
jgi:cytochrome c oxidase subunit 3